MTDKPENRWILRNIAYAFSTWILPLFLGLVVMRVVVRSLGNVDYGIYALVQGFLAYSFNFGIARAITKYLASYRASGETEKIRGVISATFLITVVIAVAGSFLIFVLSPWLVSDVFQIEPDSQAKTITAIRISSATISLLAIWQIGTAVLQGLHRFDVFSKVQNVGSITLMLGNLILAYSGFGLLALLYWNLAATGFSCSLALFSAWGLLPDFGFEFDRESIRLVVRYSASVIGHQVIANAFFLFERSWIIAKLGAEALTFYAVPMTIGIYFHSFIASLSLVLFPLASELNNDRTRLIKLYQAATKTVSFVVVIVSTSLVATGKLFLTLWMGPVIAAGSATLLTFHAIAFGMVAIGIISFQTAEGLGHPSFNFRNTAVGTAIALPVIFWLTDPMGNIGVAIGRLIVFLVPFLAISQLESRYLGGFKAEFWLSNGSRLLIAALGSYFSERFLLTFYSESWFTLFAAVATGSIVYLSILFVSGFITQEDRRMIRKLVGSEA
jgi:O-antigen/teichoic acid export membrane protein